MSQPRGIDERTATAERTPEIESPLSRLSPEQIDELGREFDAIRDRVRADLGERDRRYIESMIEMHRRLGGDRAGCCCSPPATGPPALAGTAALSAAKILENMEIGHNVLHGQWDWMNDPHIHSSTWDWDTASTAEAWKHSHNYVHHTFTNIRGKDKDLGYEIMRIDPEQKWHPVYLFQPLYNLLLVAFFEWGVALHDLDFEAIRKGEKSKAAGAARAARASREGEEPGRQGLHRLAAAERRWRRRRSSWRWRRSAGAARSRRQPASARAAWPAACGARSARAPRRTATTAARRTRPPTSSATSGPTRSSSAATSPTRPTPSARRRSRTRAAGGWYVRQLSGAANIEGGPLFHVASGNLGYQVEHHLFPDLPSTRYAEIAPQVKDICERYGLPYNSGPFMQQLGMVQRTILRLAFPGGKPRPKPGPYRGGGARRLCVT